MTIVKPRTLNRPLAELRQLRERPELIGTLTTEEQRKVILFAICVEETNRDRNSEDLLVKHAPPGAQQLNLARRA